MNSTDRSVTSPPRRRIIITHALARALLVPTLLAAAGAAHAAPATPADCQAAAAYSAARDGVSFLVMRDGKVICTDYPGGNTADTAHLLASGTKSFTGVIAAAAAQDGFLTLDEHVADTITEWRNDPRKAKVTIRQLLGLIGGVPGGPGQVPTYAEAIALPLASDPGTRFRYGPASFQIFGELMKRKLAAHHLTPDPLDYLTRRVLDPIGVKPAGWRRGPDGDPNMPSGASITATAWAPFGEFMRLGGRWQGKQLVDPTTLAQLTKSGPVNPGYGISWWVEGAKGTVSSPDAVSATVDLTAHAGELPAGIYLAAGAGIQRLYVIPSAHLVVVRQAENRSRAERQARRRAQRQAMTAEGASNEDARAALWSDAAFLKLVLGLK